MIALYDNSYYKVIREIVGKHYDDDKTREAMKEVYDEIGYVMCPHTALAYLGLKEYLEESGSKANGVLLSTAHPAKFDDVVNTALDIEIELPLHLAEIAKRKKEAIPMSKDFEGFKAYLLK
jgi:threonine synthase